MPNPVVCPPCFDGMHSACTGANGCYCDCNLEDHPLPAHVCEYHPLTGDTEKRCFVCQRLM